ncbi:hypothetical protein ACHHYP_02428 [Achlya hypogyna]|uniref:FYVE-type domain-containing protein n=1 Tax=Achlya hypogyna TaxID=1202772 RepID=A0A1V9Z6E1_ACHHY|nr:hypothetical protein ACHHYP_02428 [Achlya hypogyna]
MPSAVDPLRWEELSQRAQHRQLVEDIARDAVQNSDLWVDEARDDRSGWKLTVNKRNMQVFRARLLDAGKANPSLYTFLTVGYLATGFEELRQALVAPTSIDDQIVQSYLLEKDFVTSHVVHNYIGDDEDDDLLDRGSDVDFFGVKYLKFTLPGTKLGVHARDTVYLEYITVLPDNHGIDTLCKVIYSIDNCVPSVEPDVYRATIMDTMLFRPAQNGKIHVVVKSYHDMKGNVPKYLGDQSSLCFWRIHRKIASLAHIRSLLAATQLRPSASLTQSHPITRASYKRVIEHTKKTCVVCVKKFSLFSTKLLCRLCALTMCSKCVLRVSYAIQDARTTVATMHKASMTTYTEEFCLICVRAHAPCTDDPNQIASTAATTPVDMPAWPFSDSVASAKSSFSSKPARPSETYFGTMNFPGVRRSSTAGYRDEREYRLSKEEQPPLVLLTPSQMSALEDERLSAKEAPDVFEEMRKSIAIQESLLSAMRASWHGTTEAEGYMPRRMSRMDRERMSEERFARDENRFEELDA